MLMFAKLSPKSFVHDLVDTFMFPNKKISEIYKKYNIDFIYIYQLLTDTGSTSIQFIIFCNDQNKVKEKKNREIIFEVITNNKIVNRFEVSHDYWKKYNVQDKDTKKRLGIFEIEHIDDPCHITIALNPKEYIEKFESDAINKKHRGIRKDTNAMDIASYGKQINLVRGIEHFGQLKKKPNNKIDFP